MFKIYLTAALVLNLFTLVTQNVAYAFQTELGFKRLSDPSTPASLKKASASVFEVRIVSEEKLEDVRIFDLTSAEFSDIENKIENGAGLDDLEKIVIQKQIQFCRQLGNLKACPMLLGIWKATGFLAGGDGSLFFTNAHVVDHFVKLRAAASKNSISDVLKSDTRVAMFIFDSNGKLVFNPFEEYAKIAIYEKPSLVAQIQGSWYAEDTDYVGIQLSRSIGQPLVIGAKPQGHEMIYRPGFASCTGCAANPNTTDPLNNNDRGEGKNSSGQGMYWTAGELQSTDEAAQFLGLTEGMKSVYKMDQMLFFGADAQVGFSGGPMLNERGEVVGIFAGSKPKQVGASVLSLSRGVRPAVFDTK